MQMERDLLERTGKQVLDALYEVHTELGPGLLENAYEMALAHELNLRGIAFERQKTVPLQYKGVLLECGFRMDVLVADAIVLELKSVEALLPIHDAQLVNYLRLSGMHLGFLVNFNVARLKDGIRRRVHNLDQDERLPRDFAL
jgi:GxxExxY protein